MQDLAIATGAERTVLVSGATYRVPKFTPAIVGRINAWLKDEVPNPKDKARERMAGLSDAVALEIWRDAVEEARDWPITFGSPKGDLYLMRFDGATRILYELLGVTTPGFTMEQARVMMNAIGIEGVNHIISLAGAEIREPIRPGDDDPKA